MLNNIVAGQGGFHILGIALRHQGVNGGLGIGFPLAGLGFCFDEIHFTCPHIEVVVGPLAVPAEFDPHARFPADGYEKALADVGIRHEIVDFGTGQFVVTQGGISSKERIDVGEEGGVAGLLLVDQDGAPHPLGIGGIYESGIIAGGQGESGAGFFCHGFGGGPLTGGQGHTGLDPLGHIDVDLRLVDTGGSTGSKGGNSGIKVRIDLLIYLGHRGTGLAFLGGSRRNRNPQVGIGTTNVITVGIQLHQLVETESPVGQSLPFDAVHLGGEKRLVGRIVDIGKNRVGIVDDIIVILPHILHVGGIDVAVVDILVPADKPAVATLGLIKVLTKKVNGQIHSLLTEFVMCTIILVGTSVDSVKNRIRTVHRRKDVRFRYAGGGNPLQIFFLTTTEDQERNTR